MERHEKNQPVLVGTVSIENSELISDMLKKKGVKHQVLNAKYHAEEAEIISRAGQPGIGHHCDEHGRSRYGYFAWRRRG